MEKSCDLTTSQMGKKQMCHPKALRCRDISVKAAWAGELTSALVKSTAYSHVS